MRRHVRIPVTLASLVLSAISVFAGDTLPFDLELDVAFGRPAGPESIRERVEYDLLVGLERAACFRSVRLPEESGDAPVDVVLEVRLDDFEELTDFDTNLAARIDPNAPPEIRNSLSARIQATVRLAVRDAVSGAVVRGKRFSERHSHRPVLREDPRAEARRQFESAIVSAARRFACGGSPKKWTRDLERARSSERRPPANR